MKRRALLTAAGGAAAAIAGCLGSIGGGTPAPPENGLIQAGQGDYPHDIYVHNALDREVTLALIVKRGGREIYRAEPTVAADTGAVVAGITEVTLPADDRRLTVTARTKDGQSSRVEVDVSDCLGSVDFSIDASGELFGTYSIC